MTTEDALRLAERLEERIAQFKNIGTLDNGTWHDERLVAGEVEAAARLIRAAVELRKAANVIELWDQTGTAIPGTRRHPLRDALAAFDAAGREP